MRQIRPAVRASTYLILAALALGGCSGGDGTGLDGPPPLEASFSSIQANVFTPTCATAGCHQGASAPQGLRLEEAVSYAMLVNVASSEDPGVLRIAPGNPDASYLVQKLEGSASVGAQMPLNAAPLPQATIDVIRQWITDGAMDDRGTSQGPVRVTSLTPEPGSDGLAPAEIVATFDRELDVSTVNANTFLLETSGGDGTFGDGNETAISAAAITTAMMTPTSATFDLAVTTPYSGATLEAIQAAVFTPTCANAGCHTGDSPPEGLRLDEGFSFDNLV